MKRTSKYLDFVENLLNTPFIDLRLFINFALKFIAVLDSTLTEGDPA